ncbi:aminodeoxychorismate synthase component I [Rubinisphaera italica]|uniref:aminodeoxychorismate synthase n=1 Tax=Rubinisphaera italica TaxID=2527969 RepID=A0A5C5XKP4_9PLAN|nr:aminodeoxychorismate synthase component I [Rubinisphaera italica]TWT63796.1 Aminodeoxychorismate synthase component 1 [Rubinisphaera italica]
MSLERVPLKLKLSPVEALTQLSDEPWPVLLESARFEKTRGRYSYLTADPVKTWKLDQAEFGSDPFAEIRLLSAQYSRPAEAGLPPFCSGFLGLLSYELGHAFEKLPTVPRDEFTTPAMAVGLYDWSLCWDHLTNETFLIRDHSLQSASKSDTESRWQRLLQKLKNGNASIEQFPTPSPRTIEPTSAERERFLNSAQRVLEYIRAGDIYQANLSRKIEYEFDGSALDLYRQIRILNPAPFAAYFQPVDDFAVVSASPEQFLQVNNRQVCTRPIKGTRPRWAAGDLDLYQGLALQASEKDRAENTMIVDLLRNDISRVCKTGSVKVPRWCELETFAKVHHLVSEVTGELQDDADIWDLFAATFPGGSITGAPKIRAMQIISELEQSTRGAYCGSLFAADLSGSLQSSLLIRTLTWKPGQVQVPVGGGIVADSVPEIEFSETVHKSAGLIASPMNHLTTEA